MQAINLKAVIDLGSLKAKLTIFDPVAFNTVLQKNYLILLGKDIYKQGKILSESLGRLDEALQKAKKELEAMGCEQVQFIATESLRAAENQEDVYRVVQEYFPARTITILDQTLEGEMFFKAVSKCFVNHVITAMDVGGGSVQILKGNYENKENKPMIGSKYLYKTGTYKLQQKFSPDNNIISQNFDKAIIELKQEYESLKLDSDILVFGSTCMQDFLIESQIPLYKDRPIFRHPFYTTISDLKILLLEIRKFAPNNRSHFYPSGEYFIYGADYLLINVIEAAERLGARYIYPTNLSSAYGFLQENN